MTGVVRPGAPDLPALDDTAGAVLAPPASPARTRARPGRRGGAPAALRAALPGWLLARVVVAGALVADRVVRAVAGPPANPIGTKLHTGLLSWDASWYQRIADHGYEPLPREGLRFFPVMPLVVRALTPPGWRGFALVVVANVAALVFAALVYRLTMDELGDERLARRAAVLTSIVPIAFVLVMGYTEAVFGILAVSTFLLARRRSWLAAAAVAAAAGALRPSGLLLTVPLAVEAPDALGPLAWRDRGTRALAVAAPVLGTLPYLVWVQAVYGDWRLPYRVQQVPGLKGHFANPAGTIAHALGQLPRGGVDAGLHGLWALAFVGLLAAMAASPLPRAYVAFSATCLAVGVGTTSLGSMERYAFAAFPFTITIAWLADTPRRWRVVAALSVLAMAGYALAAFLDAYVP